MADYSKYLNEISDIGTIISSIVAIISLIAIWYQLKKQKDIAEAEFVFSILEAFTTHKDFIEKINPYNKRDKTLDHTYKGEIVSFLGFYESLFYLIEKKVITLDFVNNSFGYSFFSLVHNEYVQETEIEPFKEYYSSIFKLYTLLYDFRTKNSLEIIGLEHSLHNL